LGNILFEAMRHFIDALPRNSMGKVQKNAIRRQYA
jgi:acyl-coenzyme A synthetase/AMP-(fatty) acid ligase